MPLLDIFWTTLVIFAWVMWFMLLFRVYGDLFSRDDIGGWAKAGWVVFTLFLPFLGVFVYLIAEGRAMADRTARAIDRQRAATDAYIRSVVADTQADQAAQGGAMAHDQYDRTVPAPRSA